MALVKSPLSQIPRPALYGLVPLIVFVAVGIGCVLGSYWLLLEPSRLRVEQLQAAYEEARQVHEKRVAAKQVQGLVRSSQRDLEKLWETSYAIYTTRKILRDEVRHLENSGILKASNAKL